MLELLAALPYVPAVTMLSEAGPLVKGTGNMMPWRSPRCAQSVPDMCRPSSDRLNLEVHKGFQELDGPINIVTEIEPVRVVT